jgi:tryptophan synthase alpha chain
MTIEAEFRAKREAGRALLVPYITGGLGAWRETIEEIAAAGADAIEIGIPFSDPIMDGPVIQRSSQQALESGATPQGIVAELAGVDVDVPLVVMTYYNPVHHMGHQRFADALAAAGVAGSIVPDLPVDESDPWITAAETAGIENILLAAPTTTDERLTTICERSRGWIYGIALLGVTGERSSVAEAGLEMGRRLKAATDKPVLLGLGISDGAQAATVAEVADGVIVGSAVVRRQLEGSGPPEVGEFVALLRAGLDAR